MTESTALSCILHPDFFQYGPVGVPVPSCEIKLVDFEEAGYFSANSPPQGEIWIRGNSITTGYCTPLFTLAPLCWTRFADKTTQTTSRTSPRRRSRRMAGCRPEVRSALHPT